MPQFFDTITADIGSRANPGYSFNGQSGTGMFTTATYAGLSFNGSEVFRTRAFTTINAQVVGALMLGPGFPNSLPKTIFQVYDTHNGFYLNKIDLGGSFLGGISALGFNLSRDETGEWKSYGDSSVTLNGAVQIEPYKSGDLVISQFPSAAGTDIVRTATQVVAARVWRFSASLKSILPETDNISDLGSSSKRIRNIYLVNQPTVTSDATTKDNARLLNDTEMQAWGSISPKIYNLRGDTMLQAGLLAQEIITAFTTRGLDVTKYSFLMKDNVSGLYALRYGECMMFEAAFQRSRTTALETAVNRLLTTLNLGGLLKIGG